MRQKQLLSSLGVMTAGALWGFLWLPLSEFDQQGLGVGLSSAIFYVVTALCAVPGLFAKAQWRHVLTKPYSLIVMGSAFTLYTFALLLTHPINAILLFYLTPAWSILLGRLIYGEPIGLVRALVVAAGFLGVGLVLGATNLPIPQNLGDWIALSSGALWAYATSLTSREPGDHSFARLMQFSIAGLVSTLVLAVMLSGVAPKVLTATAPASVYVSAAAFGLVLFAIPNLLVIFSTSHLSSARVGVLLMMEVVVGTIAIATLSAQPIAIMQMFGAALIVAAGITEVLSRDSHTT